MVVQREDKHLVSKRVLYIGSSVPMETAHGLDAVQQPLKDRYPTGDESKIQGIDANVSITTGGITLQYVEDSGVIIFFPIGSLSLCAAVRHVKTVNASTGDIDSRFVSLSSPQAKGIHIRSPAIFTAITRRTKGRRVLECHGFMCASDRDAMELVRATSAVDKSIRAQGGTTRTTMSEQQTRTMDARISMRSDDSRMSMRSDHGYVSTATNGVDRSPTLNGHSRQNSTTNGTAVPAMRLTPGETMPRAGTQAPKEFFEPPPAQGYFYSSAKTEVKKFNIEKDGPDAEPYRVQNGMPRPRTPSPRPSIERAERDTVASAPAYMMNRPQPPPGAYMRHPIYTHGPPPPPQMMRRPQPMFMRPPPHRRFFSPPPPRSHPPPMMVPPPHPFMGAPPHPQYMGGPPPPPMFIMRHRRRSGSQESGSSSSSRDGSPRSPHMNGFNRDGSESSFGRPPTPPRDYEAGYGGERLSRRDQFEKKKKGRSRRPKSPMRYGPMSPPPPHPNTYYVYANPYGPPDPYPFGRSLSVPPHARYSSEDHRRHHRKPKKSKKNKQNDESVDTPGEFKYPTFDQKNQFMSEKAFSKSIKAEHLNDNEVPTAYELNQVDQGNPNDQFLLY